VSRPDKSLLVDFRLAAVVVLAACCTAAAGEPNLFGRLDFEITYSCPLPYSQLSGLTWNRRADELVALNQNSQLIHLSDEGRTLRTIEIKGPPSHDWEAVQWLGNTERSDKYAIVYEGRGAIYFVYVPFDARSISLSRAEEVIVLPSEKHNIEALCVDLDDPNVFHAWTYSVGGGDHFEIQRGDPTVILQNPYYRPQDTAGHACIRDATFDSSICANPIRAKGNTKIGELQELEIKTGKVVSHLPVSIEGLKPEGLTFKGNALYLVCEGKARKDTFYRFEPQ
jgi:hypothetical protein